jgi:hypothetical protein
VSTDEEGRATATARTQRRGARYNERRKQVLLRRRCRRRRHQICYYATFLRLRRDCHTVFSISTNNCSIWPNFYQNPMQFDLFPTSSKFRLTWVRVQSLQRLRKLHIWRGSSPGSDICCRSPSTHSGLICGLTASINPLLTFGLSNMAAGN